MSEQADPVTGTQIINPEGLVEARGYSHVAVVTGSTTIYVAGQTGCDSSGTLVSTDSYEEQTYQALRNIGTALAGTEADCADIVRVSIYVVNYADESAPRGVGRAFKRATTDLGWPAVPTVLLGVDRLSDPQALVEIDVIAAR